ncbi:STAS domain-containing protein [Yinghuangia seranimata]|uniref:STAS domain-containing protein n=1 Tax=Yinghuangia seranimata TaxID=408067 RepID=UPI00248D2159|nr:STAS domain-containing protein [Yinghuangia seranimata]MDI2129017.1 STAS domain-containing protein [Yinghuangia seranimata]
MARQPRKGYRRAPWASVQVDYLTVDYAAADGVALVVAVGEIDGDSASQLREAVDRALRTEPTTLHLDMEQVTFCDSSGLHVLVHARRVAAESGGTVTISPSPAMTSLLDMTGTTRLFPDRPPTAAAMDGLLRDPGGVLGADTLPAAGPTPGQALSP